MQLNCSENFRIPAA